MDYHDLFRFTLDSIMINLSSDNIHNHAGFVKEHRVLYKGILKKYDLYTKPKKIDIHMINTLSLQSICYIAEEIHIYLYAVESIATTHLIKRLEKVASSYDLNLLDQQTDTINYLTRDKEILEKTHSIFTNKIKVLNNDIQELSNTNE